MNLTGVTVIALAFCYCCADNGYFWHITDFHWDFSYHGKGLSCTASNSSGRGDLGSYLCDSPWKLLDETLAEARKIKPDPEFIIWTGDTSPHFKSQYLSTALVIKTLENITSLIKTHFPDVTVYPALGNHDYYPKDQFPPHNNVIYNTTYNLWKSWIADESQEKFFLKGGYYSVQTKQGHRIIALNTNLYYNDNETRGLKDPADQFSWLEDQLKNASSRNEKVLIIGHVPPGYTTPQAICQMKSHFNEDLVHVVLRHADVITAMHFGHEHHDNFRLLYNSSGFPVIPVFLAPSVTPITWKGWKTPERVHNPGVRLIKFDRQSNRQLDILQYYVDLPTANREKRVYLKTGYSATDMYGIPDIMPEALSKLIDKFEDPTGVYLKDYLNWYDTNATKAMDCDATCHKAIMCGLRNFKKRDFSRCFRGTDVPIVV